MKNPPNKPLIFYDDIYSLIKNLLINNKNYNNNYVFNRSKTEIIADTKSRANYILQRMEAEKHLLESKDNE